MPNPSENKIRPDNLFETRRSPVIPTASDFEIFHLGGLTTAFDTSRDYVQSTKSSISPQQRLVELVRENGRLRQEAAYFRELNDQVLAMLSVLRYHVGELLETIDKSIDYANSANERWRVERTV